MFKIIDQLDIRGKRVFIRTDYNISLKDGKILDDTRIRSSLKTIEYAISQGAKIILASHLGRPKGERNEKYSLMPVAERLSELLNKEIIFPDDCVGDGVKKLVGDLREGDIILLENLRFHADEEKNDPHFAKKLASLAQIYVNDAFGAVHRAHASTVGMVEYFTEKGIGFLMQKEIIFLDGLLKGAKKPFLAILGGAKVSDKIDLIENLMHHVDCFLIGGGMAYTFLKAKGFDIGNSLLEESKVSHASRILKKAEQKGIEILLPIDSVLAPKLEANTATKIAHNGENWANMLGLDIGPETVASYVKKIASSATIFWNGPMGVFEVPPFEKGTFEIAKYISQSKAVTVVGGGDSLTAIKLSGVGDHFTHLSTGGGASMEFLEGKALPGLRAVAVPP
ncbi:MAG: hypothetical protein ACD_73C00133G0003 [uncultured bacterium]|nr:MAG: hypothetical protein ACD_73C00133G0003 [uncultured bacterium]